MGVGFNWFKNYRIIEDEIDYGLSKDIEYSVEYIDGDSTSHAYGNRTKLQDIFEKYLNIRIPTISYRGYSESYKNLNLIKPSKMSKLCAELLENKHIYDLEDLEDRIEWIKEKSDDGYYISYDDQ